ASAGRVEEADKALSLFEARSRTPLPPMDHTAMFEGLTHKHPKRGIADLFGKVYLSRTISVAALWATCGFLQYGLSTWLPTLYKTVYHAPLQLSLNLAAFASVLGVVGSVVCALLVDKVGRKPVMVVSFILCAFSLVLAGVLHTASIYVVAT